MVALLLGEPGDDRLVDGVVLRRLRDPVAPEHAVDVGAGEAKHRRRVAERRGEAPRKGFVRRAGSRAYQRERRHACAGPAGARGALPQSPRRGARDLQHGPRVAVEQAIERGARQPQQVTVAHRGDRGRARLPGQERQFAHRAASPRFLDHALPARRVGVAHGHPQAPVDDDVDVLAAIALPEQRLAAGSFDPVELGLQIGDRRGLEVAEQLGQHPYQLGAPHARQHAAQEHVERPRVP